MNIIKSKNNRKIRFSGGFHKKVISIVEEKSVSKSGDENLNEDRVIVTDHFIAIVDGMTPKDKDLYENKSLAVIAGDLIEETLLQLSKEYI
ncbi:hypothetical protein [Oceanobacillus salinisoli]|uniref:hypothetical protein n=1 Tax=Oceanobacillus salinisoli TaxID=2678611 RepID=UPI0012E12584|nr:hypothetical protein [Oceanobacillus salinisoli]